MLLAQAVLISVDELLDFRSAASIFTSQRRMSLGLHRFARTSPGHSMKCPKPVRKAGSLQRCQQYWLHFMRRELFIVHQRTSSTRRAKKRKNENFLQDFEIRTSRRRSPWDGMCLFATPRNCCDDHWSGTRCRKSACCAQDAHGERGFLARGGPWAHHGRRGRHNDLSEQPR